METKQVQVNIRLSATLKEQAERVASQDHRSLTSLVEKLLTQYVRAQPCLEEWHERAMARLLGIIADRKMSSQIEHGLFARSYSIITKNGEQVSPHSLTTALQRTQNTLNNMIPSPEFVYPYTRPELSPYFTSDNKLSRGKTEEILESIALPDIVSTPEFWRVSPAGIVTDIRPHFEDREWFAQKNLLPGKWFCPFFMTRQLAAMVLHASILNERFPSAETIEFRCEWSGLRERIIADANPISMWLPGKIARVDHRVSVGEWPADHLRGSWPEIVSELGGPVMRMFDEGFDYSPDFVRSQIDRFKS